MVRTWSGNVRNKSPFIVDRVVVVGGDWLGDLYFSQETSADVENVY